MTTGTPTTETERVAPAEPERLGAYTLLEKLGAGGMAVVYRAERLGEAGFKKKVAIKRILPQYRRDASLLERFAAEARTNARLDHPNLVQVLDFGIEPEPFLVLEFVEGVSLSQVMQRLLDRKETLELAAALFVTAEAATGLDHAHRKRDDDGNPLGIVHRDVSPQNVLLSNEGSVKVSDFGLVKAADNVLKTASGVSIGKISYMAPEQAAGAPVDARSDVFALGVTLWELLTLQSLIPPNDPGKAAQMLKDGGFPRPSELRKGVPERVDRIVMSCLAIDPAQRMPSAQQLSLELRETLHELAAGYGKQQLARMLQWLFPEKGWALLDPDQPPLQPSAEERQSMMPVMPAAVALQRAQDGSSGPPPPPDAARTTGGLPAVGPRASAGMPAALGPPSAPMPAVPDRPMPSAPGIRKAPRWLIVTAIVGVGATAMLLLSILAAGLYYVWHQLAERSGAITVESTTPGVRLWLGTREIGPPPIMLAEDDLTGEPLIALAPGHRASFVRGERLLELVRGPFPSLPIALDPSQTPEIIAYVRYDGQGIAHLADGEDIGPVPGAIVVPLVGGVAPDLVIWDEAGHETATLSLAACVPDAVCVLRAGNVTE